MNTQDSSTTTWPPVGFLEKKIAAERLGVTESRVAQLGDAIKTQRARNPKSHQWVILYHEGDVERYRFERENPSEVPKLPAKIDKPNPFEELAKTGMLSIRNLPTVAEKKPWMTISEASEWSGLPASTIARLIKTGVLLAIDCGPRPGGKWRVKRLDLEKLEGLRYQ